MMGIYIKGMEMPKDRLYPITVTIYSSGNVFVRDRDDKNVYQAVPVPLHGDLIDVDETLKNLPEHYSKDDLEDAIATAPAIIPADPAQEEG